MYTIRAGWDVNQIKYVKYIEPISRIKYVIKFILQTQKMYTRKEQHRSTNKENNISGDAS